MAEIPQDVAENYLALKAERGLSWEQLAAQAAQGRDANLAAWMRRQQATADIPDKTDDEDTEPDVRDAPVPAKGPRRTTVQK